MYQILRLWEPMQARFEGSSESPEGLCALEAIGLQQSGRYFTFEPAALRSVVGHMCKGFCSFFVPSEKIMSSPPPDIVPKKRPSTATKSREAGATYRQVDRVLGAHSVTNLLDNSFGSYGINFLGGVQLASVSSLLSSVETCLRPC